MVLEVTPQQHHRKGDGPDEGNAAGGFAIDQRDKSHGGVLLLCPAPGSAAPRAVTTQSPRKQTRHTT